MKFKTEYNQEEFPRVQEKNETPSMSIPDMSLSVQELLRRFSNGMPIVGNNPGSYDYEDNESEEHEFLLPNLEAMDIYEREQLLIKVREMVENTRAEINENLRIQREKAIVEAKEKEFQEWEKRRKPTVVPPPGEAESTN